MVNLVVLFWIIIAFGYFLAAKFRKDKKLERAWWDFGDHKWLVISMFSLFVALAAINLFTTTPRFTSAQQKIDHGITTQQPWLVIDGCTELLKDDPYNADLNFQLITHVFLESTAQEDTARYRQLVHRMAVRYYRMSNSDTERVANRGHLWRGACYYFSNDPLNAQQQLGRITTGEMKYFNYLSGLVAAVLDDPGSPTSPDACFRQEIAINGYKEGAYKELSAWFYIVDRGKLDSLVHTPDGRKYVPYEYRKSVWYNDHEWGTYFIDQFAYIFSSLTPIAFAGALLVMIIWVFYLRHINRGSGLNWKRTIVTLLLASAFVMPVWFLYDTYRYLLHFGQNGRTVNDLTYCIFGIGLLEETVKIVPFLLLLRFTRWIKEPIDYIVYASLVAIGFAFVENLRYFTIGQQGLDTIHSRAFSAVIAHMINTSIIAYGLILARFRYGRPPALFFFPFLLIASISHGFYDFWILNEEMREFSVITLVYLFTCVLFYSSFINNALNNSPSAQAQVKLNTRLLSSNLAASLIFVFVFEVLALAALYGGHIASKEFFSSVATGGYMILFLSVRLSNIDIVPCEWAPLQFFTSLNPLNVIYNTKLNFNSVVGLKLKFTPARAEGLLSEVLPMEGEVVKRENISGFSGWFRVKLEKAIPVNAIAHREIFIRARHRDELIENNNSTEVIFNVPVDETVLQKKEIRRSDLLLVGVAVVN